MTKTELKKGQVVYSKWNEEETIIEDIKDGRVYYRSKHYGSIRISIDTIETFLECFKLQKNK